jgi:hypothetical protein
MIPPVNLLEAFFSRLSPGLDLCGDRIPSLLTYPVVSVGLFPLPIPLLAPLTLRALVVPFFVPKDSVPILVVQLGPTVWFPSHVSYVSSFCPWISYAYELCIYESR